MFGHHALTAALFASLFHRDRFRRSAPDALSLQTVGENPKPIVFSEWSLVNGSMVKRRDFSFHELLSYAGNKEQPLFSDLGEEVSGVPWGREKGCKI